MVDGASEFRETFDEFPIPKNMIDTKAVCGRAPSPIALVAVPHAPQINEAGFIAQTFKKIGAVEARSLALDIKIISAGVEVADHDEW